MDVWFDSGSSHTGAMIARGLGYPADLYFEGSDQYRGWFNSSSDRRYGRAWQVHRIARCSAMASSWMRTARR